MHYFFGRNDAHIGCLACPVAEGGGSYLQDRPKLSTFGAERFPIADLDHLGHSAGGLNNFVEQVVHGRGLDDAWWQTVFSQKQAECLVDLVVQRFLFFLTKHGRSGMEE